MSTKPNKRHADAVVPIAQRDRRIASTLPVGSMPLSARAARRLAERDAARAEREAHTDTTA